MKQTDKVKEQLQERINELDGNWKRALADYKNLEFRTEKAVREALTFGTKGLIIKLLKVLDELDMAVEHHPDQAWAKMTRDEMECVSKTEGAENIVVKIVQKGYKIYDQVLRPARVEVGSGENEQTNKVAKEQTN